jgi:hypothetical protein
MLTVNWVFWFAVVTSERAGGVDEGLGGAVETGSKMASLICRL